MLLEADVDTLSDEKLILAYAEWDPDEALMDGPMGDYAKEVMFAKGLLRPDHAHQTQRGASLDWRLSRPAFRIYKAAMNAVYAEGEVAGKTGARPDPHPYGSRDFANKHRQWEKGFTGGKRTFKNGNRMAAGLAPEPVYRCPGVASMVKSRLLVPSAEAGGRLICDMNKPEFLGNPVLLRGEAEALKKEGGSWRAAHQAGFNIRQREGVKPGNLIPDKLDKIVDQSSVEIAAFKRKKDAA